MKWKAFFEQYAKDNPHIKLNPPATEQEMAEVESILHVQLPADIKDLWRECNGDNWFVFPHRK